MEKEPKHYLPIAGVLKKDNEKGKIDKQVTR
jgi:hypothetical protein